MSETREAKGVTINVMGREFRVAAPGGEERQLAASVEYLNKKMREIRDTGKVVGNERIAIMAALNIAHEFLQLQAGGSALRVNDLVPWESPLYKAGVAQEDQLVNLGGVDLTSLAAFEQALAKQKPGVGVPLRYVRRSGETVNGTITLDEDPRVEIVTLEATGGMLTDDQRRFRESWLNSQRR